MVVATGEGGAAAESGQVGVGDVLHEINNESVRGAEMPHVIQLLQGDVGSAVILLLQSTTIQKEASPMAKSAHKETSAPAAQSHTAQAQNEMVTLAQAQIEMVALMVTLEREGNVAVPQSGVRGAQNKLVTLEREGNVAGSDVVSAMMPLGASRPPSGNHVVSAMMPLGAAERCTQIALGDSILSVDGTYASNLSVQEVIELIRGPIGSSEVIELIRGPIGSSVSLLLAPPPLPVSPAAVVSPATTVSSKKDVKSYALSPVIASSKSPTRVSAASPLSPPSNPLLGSNALLGPSQLPGAAPGSQPAAPGARHMKVSPSGVNRLLAARPPTSAQAHFRQAAFVRAVSDVRRRVRATVVAVWSLGQTPTEAVRATVVSAWSLGQRVSPDRLNTT
ncbi:hypothetical protein T484DRAFT_1760732, partial [Baffinella frigidus]